MGDIRFHNNGQWTLKKNWTDAHKESADEWVESGIREHLDKLPRAEKGTRTRMLAALDKDSKSIQVNKDTGEKEHKLYRASYKGNTDHTKQNTSWTTDKKMAYYWTHINSPVDKDDFPDYKDPQVVHAWVPEKHIHSYLQPILDERAKAGVGNDGKPYDARGENEVVVHPHNLNVHHIEEGKALTTKVNAIMDKS